MPAIIRKVLLREARFFAHHGFYAEERLTGTAFTVDIAVSSLVKGDGGDEIGRTVNYEELHHIAASRMAVPMKLLETVGELILADVQKICPGAIQIFVAVNKLHPPLKGQVGSASVTLTFSA